MKISDVDKNLIVNTNLSRSDVILYDVCNAPFKICGVMPPENDNDRFRRIPESIARNISNGVMYLHTNTAGGRIRFKTDAEYIAIKTVMPEDKVGKMPHFTLAGSAGFDLYTKKDSKEYYIHTFLPPVNIKDGYVSELSSVPNPCMRDYTLNMPLYSDVSKLFIILNKGARILPCDEYKLNKPIVFYGSSITQGGCASRPGNSYQSIISRELDCDFINLGFSGNAKAEDEFANYIADLDMSVFVYDYDHNAPDIKHLQNTHNRMFDIIRSSNPDIPIICISRPISYRFEIREDENIRRQIICDTVNNAKLKGDNNVYFIDGRDFSSKAYAPDSLSVDGCHPNDLGFSCMAQVIADKIKEALKKQISF